MIWSRSLRFDTCSSLVAGKGVWATVVARRWSWVLVLAAGLALFELVQHAILVTGNPNLVPALILLGAAVMPAAFLAFVAGWRLEFGISSGAVALTALIGGVIGVVTAGLLEFDTLRRLGAVPMLAVGLIEEAAKLIAPLAIVLYTRHRHPADGLLVGVASGAGFAALETMGYAFVVLLQSHGNLAVVDDVLFMRGLLSPAAHMAWTGLTAAALWRAADQHWRPVALGHLVAIYLLAVALHTAADSAVSPMVYLVIALISLVALAVTAHQLAAPGHRPDTMAAQHR
jgi:RsiW-degrading membrane proteinase PrsW (M82 family)